MIVIIHVTNYILHTLLHTITKADSRNSVSNNEVLRQIVSNFLIDIWIWKNIEIELFSNNIIKFE